MKKFVILFLLLLCWLFAAESPLVMLDIGHSAKDSGAASPDGKLSEAAFWYKNAREIKRELEQAVYRCIVCNRGNAPTQEPLAGYAKAAIGGACDLSAIFMQGGLDSHAICAILKPSKRFLGSFWNSFS